MLVQLEIIFFFLSFLFIIYYFFDSIFSYFRSKKIKRLERIERKKSRKIARWKLEESKQESASDSWIKEKNEWKRNVVSTQDNLKIRNILWRAQVNISRWYLESAKLLIVDGLAIKKDDKDLNLALADIYEREKKYANAESIYRDVLLNHWEDEFTLTRLWYTLALQWNNIESFDVYTLAFELNNENMEVLDTLANLWLELRKYKKALKYSNLFLKQRPRDSEKLWIKGFCHEALWDSEEAIHTYRKLLEVQPYNSEVQDRIEQLLS